MLDMLDWVPGRIAALFTESPITFGVIALGVVLMVVARAWGRGR